MRPHEALFAKAWWNVAVGDSLAAAAVTFDGDASHALRAGRLGGARVEFVEAAATILVPGCKVVRKALFALGAVLVLVEARAFAIGPSAFHFRMAFLPGAVILLPEAAARVELPSALHSGGARLAAAVLFVEEADALATEEGGAFALAALLQAADPVLASAHARFLPEEAALVRWARLRRALRLCCHALAQFTAKHTLLTHWARREGACLLAGVTAAASVVIEGVFELSALLP